MTDVLRFAAFTKDPKGGNPAGLWIGDTLPSDNEMQRIAARVGYSETAFLEPTSANGWKVRYFSPAAEVPFCGHATIAAGVALGERFGEGTYVLATKVGSVTVRVSHDHVDGQLTATLISVPPQNRSASLELVAEALDVLGWRVGDLDDSIPAALAYAGAWHLILAVEERRRLADLDYDFDRLRALMAANDLTTLQLIWRQDTVTFTPVTRSRLVEWSRTRQPVPPPRRLAGISAIPGWFVRRPGSTSIRVTIWGDRRVCGWTSL